MGFVSGVSRVICELYAMFYIWIQYLYLVLLPVSHRLVFNGNRVLMRHFLSFNDMHLVKDGLFHYVMRFEQVDGSIVVVKCYFFLWWFKFSGEIRFHDNGKSFFNNIFGFCLTDSQYRLKLDLFKRVIGCKWF